VDFEGKGAQAFFGGEAVGMEKKVAQALIAGLYGEVGELGEGLGYLGEGPRGSAPKAPIRLHF
jgi:hypothetical protein